MEIKINLDMNQIDYDAINKQIQEKIAALDIKDMYQVESKIENKISDFIKEEVDYAYNKYLDRYYGTSYETGDGRDLIQRVTKEEVTNKVKDIVYDIFLNDYNEETLRKMMIEFLPDIFTSILFKRMDSALFSKEYDYQNQMYNMVRSQISEEFSRRAYR